MYQGNPDVPADVFHEILERVRQFVSEKVIPREQEIAETDSIPEDLRNQIKELGLFGFGLPQRWGGLGLDIVQEVELVLWATRRWRCARSSARTTGSRDRSSWASGPRSSRPGGFLSLLRVRLSRLSPSPR